MKLLLILPYPINSDAKPRELSRVSSLQINTVEQPFTWGILPGLRTHGSLGLGSKGPYLLSQTYHVALVRVLPALLCIEVGPVQDDTTALPCPNLLLERLISVQHQDSGLARTELCQGKKTAAVSAYTLSDCNRKGGITSPRQPCQHPGYAESWHFALVGEEQPLAERTKDCN